MPQYVLPYWFEALSYMEKPGGKPGTLITPTAIQVIIPILPPDMRVVLETTVDPNWWAYIGFGTTYGAMVPDTIMLRSYWRGAVLAEAMLTNHILVQGVSFTVIIDQNDHLFVEVWNTSPVNQYFEISAGYFMVRDQDDMELIKDNLRRLMGLRDNELAGVY